MSGDPAQPSEEGFEDTIKLLETDYQPGFDLFLSRIKSIPNASISELDLLRLIVSFGQEQLDNLFFAAAVDLRLDVVDLNPDSDDLGDDPNNWAVNFKYFQGIIDRFPWVLVITDFFQDCTDTLALIDTEGRLLSGGDMDSFLKATGKSALNDQAREDLIHDQEERFTSRYIRLQQIGIMSFIETMIANTIEYRHQSLIIALPEITQLDMRGLKRSLTMQQQFLGELMTLIRQKISYES